jgi:hypothetical protein
MQRVRRTRRPQSIEPAVAGSRLRTIQRVVIIITVVMLSGCGTAAQHRVAEAKTESKRDICDSALSQLRAIARDTTFQPVIYARRSLALGSQESAAALKTIISELARLKERPSKMIHTFADIDQGFEEIAATARENRQHSEQVTRAAYASYDALLDGAISTCRRDASV